MLIRKCDEFDGGTRLAREALDNRDSASYFDVVNSFGRVDIEDPYLYERGLADKIYAERKLMGDAKIRRTSKPSFIRRGDYGVTIEMANRMRKDFNRSNSEYMKSLISKASNGNVKGIDGMDFKELRKEALKIYWMGRKLLEEKNSE